MTDDQIVAELIAREGGYANQAGDPGGATVWGLDQHAQTELLGHPPTDAETRAITKDQAAAFYRARYVAPWTFVAHDGLRVLLIDSSVLLGLPWTIGAVQTILGVRSDGVLGPQTRAAILGWPAVDLLKRFGERRGLRQIRTALSDVPAAMVKTTRLQDLEGWFTRLWAVSVEPL